MSKYNYRSWHDIKDLVSIYNESEWDNAKVEVWDPVQHCGYNLTFCGSTRPDGDKPGKIHFIINKIKPNNKECKQQ